MVDLYMQDLKKTFKEYEIPFRITEPAEKLVLIDRIIEKIAENIEKGILKPGEYLPGERELSKRFNVNRATIRLALKALDFLGVLEINPGRKTRISDSVTDLFKNPFKFLNLMHNITLEELFETRKIIEPQVVVKAAFTASLKDLKRLKGHLLTSEDNIDNKENFMISEFAFHRELFLISKNKVLTAIMINLNNLLLMLERYEGNFIDIKARKSSLDQHYDIYQAIREKDPGKAKKAMLKHLETIYQRLAKLKKA